MAARLPRLTRPAARALAVGAAVCGVWLASPARALAQARDDPRPFTRVVTADEIRRAGLVRLGDVLLLAEGWDVAGADGFAWRAAPRGLAPLQAAPWLVLVDGQRVDLGLFGTANLNRLPVPLGAIDSVVLIGAPTLAAGEVAAAGAVHVYTRRPAAGPTAGAWYTTGSEIGDPGPFAFTPRATPNVDRIGHDGSAAVGYAGARWFAALAAEDAVLPPTDPAIADRYNAAAPDPPARIRLRGGGARAGTRLGGGAHEVVLLRSSTDDFLELRPLGPDVAVAERLTHVGAGGEVPVRGGRTIRYRVTHGVNRSEARRDLVPAHFAWRAAASAASVELGSPAGLLRVVGLRARRVAVEAAQAVGRDRLTVASAYGELRPGGAGAPALAVEATVGGREVGLAATLAGRWRVRRGVTLDAAVAYARAVRAADEGLWAWTERGYPLVREAGVEVEQLEPIGRPRRLTADVAVAARAGRGITIRAGGFWRALGGLTLERQALGYVPETASFAGPVRVAGDASGRVYGAEVGGVLVRGPVTARAGYRRLGVATRDPVFADAWRPASRDLLHATAAYTPVPTLELRVAATWRGPARWPEYEAAAAQSGGRYRARVPGSLALDASVQKWLWRRRLRAHLGARNLLGATVRHHPAGASFDPSVVLQVEARLE